MKKIMLMSVVFMMLGMATQVNAETNCPPKGHNAYMHHQKHHKGHAVHRLHGRVDATYQN